MKRWFFTCAAALAGAALALTGLPAQPFSPLGWIGGGLRALSLSGAAGNASAWALWAVLSLLPLLGLLPKGRRRGAADVFFVLAAVCSFPMWYCLANPGLVATRLPEAAATPLERLPLTVPVAALLCGAAALRCTEGGATRAFLRRTRGLLVCFMALEAGAAAFTLVSGLRAAISEGGASLALAAFQGLCALAVCAAALATFSSAADLARAMEGGWFSAEAEAARLARLARLQLAVTCGSAALSSLAGLLCLGRASFALTWDLPLTELLAALACALLARFVAEGARVKRENDEFV